MSKKQTKKLEITFAKHILASTSAKHG